MNTNDLKKGDVVRLRNGWYAVIADNKKGNIRMATVSGVYTETGSVYSHDIMRKLDFHADLDQPTSLAAGVGREFVEDVDGIKPGLYLVTKIEHTEAQLKLKRNTEAFGI